ncbi:hypothetical protein TSUD_292440 [Trifolium subterraneum]|uniref:RNase H type-1 domain-containing protein n=1 Tax=Trifolium subterraneum TaxID=3900 RepID=A0A2Z6NQ55_TRISU|nr:hypothetical protein TSUD_292440 [Trifolium subterraneum]
MHLPICPGMLSNIELEILILRVRLWDIAPYDVCRRGHMSGQWKRCSFLDKHNVALIKLGSEDTSLMRCGLEGAKLFFRSRVQLGVRKGSNGIYMYSEGSRMVLGRHGNCILQVEDFSDFFYSFARMLSHNQRSSWCLLLWSLWNSRNQNLWEEITENSAAVSDRTSKFLQQWDVANQVAERPDNGSLQPVQSRWTKPPAGTLKCNVDAAFVEEEVGFGMRLRDAYGLYYAMPWLKDLNAKNVIFELYTDLFELGCIIQD